MDERIDILNENGEPAGVTAMKSEAHQKGLFHATVHIWFYTANGMILLQKRSSTKDVYPGLWDVAVAGHIGADELIVDAAVREVHEEIGLKINHNQLLKIGVFKSVRKHSKTLIDCEFHHTFISALTIPLENLMLQPYEVDDLKLIYTDQFEKELASTQMALQYVPHTKSYYATHLAEIKKLL